MVVAPYYQTIERAQKFHQESENCKADLISIPAAIYAVAALTAASGLLAAARMYETHPAPSREGNNVGRSPA